MSIFVPATIKLVVIYKCTNSSDRLVYRFLLSCRLAVNQCNFIKIYHYDLNSEKKRECSVRSKSRTFTVPTDCSWIVEVRLSYEKGNGIHSLSTMIGAFTWLYQCDWPLIFVWQNLIIKLTESHNNTLQNC